MTRAAKPSLVPAIALLALLTADASAAPQPDMNVPCSGGAGCGASFRANGWRQIAECHDHNWSYLLQRDDRVMFCSGVAGRAGPIEFPCQEFKGDLERYRVIAAMPASARISAACVLGPAVTGEAEK